ncbi:MAG: hypothetical protein M3016_02905, partial [Actinomycetota bacterium]|nr:hypothetical protein [Actinomycetota bacterium]
MNGRRPEGGISDGVMLGVIGAAAAVCAGVWVWGALAGALFGGGWTPVMPGHVLAVMGRLPSHLSDPATAWPRPQRGRLPGPVGFYGTLTLLIVGATAGVAVASRWGLTWQRSRRGGSGARWASRGELRDLRRGRGGGQARGRLVLG